MPYFVSAMPSMAARPWLESYGPKPERRCFLFVFLAERLDFDVHTRRQIELHERVHGLLRGLENVEQSLVRANLKLLARLLVHVRRTQNAVFVFYRGQRDRTGDLRSRAARRFHDLSRGLVEHAVVVRLQANANSVFSNHFLSLTPSALAEGKIGRQDAGRVFVCRGGLAQRPPTRYATE